MDAILQYLFAIGGSVMFEYVNAHVARAIAVFRIETDKWSSHAGITLLSLTFLCAVAALAPHARLASALLACALIARECHGVWRVRRAHADPTRR